MTTHSRPARRSRVRTETIPGACAAIGLALIAAADGAATPGAPPAAQTAAAATSAGDLASVVAPVRAKYDLPALAVAIVGRDGVESIGFDGVRRRGDAAAILPGDRFHLGSCTKAMTATLAAILAADGLIRFDSTVGEVLGAAVPTMDPSWKDVTVEELLRHEGGAPGTPDKADWLRAWSCKESSRECRRVFVESMLSRPIAQPRGTSVYSNQGYALAGLMLETVAKKDYETLVTERLFTPLGITSAGFGPPPEATGHSSDGKPNNTDNPAAITPAGRCHMTLADWGRFIALHVRREGADGLPLDRAAFGRLQSPAKKPADGAADAAAARGDPALGWLVTQRGWGGTVLTHAGSNTVWYCVAWVAPDKGFAVIAATNQGGDQATKACDEACTLAIASLTAKRSRPVDPTPSAAPSAPPSTPAPPRAPEAPPR